MKQEPVADATVESGPTEEQKRHADFLDGLARSMRKRSVNPEVRKIVLNLQEIARRIRENYELTSPS